MSVEVPKSVVMTFRFGDLPKDMSETRERKRDEQENEGSAYKGIV